jgi:putative SOS response-associated peptidase YedK
MRSTTAPPPEEMTQPAPGDLDQIIRATAGGRELVASSWGLIPAWSTDRSIAAKTYNARAETLMERSSFRPLVSRRRCIIPVSGFYEQVRAGRKKQPVYLSRQDGRPLALAGLWTTWTDPASGETVTSHTMITTEANAEMRVWHHRMPVILDGDALARWLDPTVTDPAHVLPLLIPAPDDTLTARRVSNERPSRNDGEQLALSL